MTVYAYVPEMDVMGHREGHKRYRRRYFHQFP